MWPKMCKMRFSMKQQTHILLLLLAIFLLGCASSDANVARKPQTKRPVTEDAQMAGVRDRVKLKQSQITKIYTRETAVYANQHGMLEITLYIDEKGNIVEAEITPKSGRFSTTLINKVKAEVSQWKFQNTKKLIYTFNIRLAKD